MKKSLVALAALAVIGAASAQSTVTLSGRIDAGIGGNTGNGVTQDAHMQSAYNSPTVFRMAGTEDMGGGLKANFYFETGSMNAATGASTGINFTRGLYAGVQGAWGRFDLGRMTSVATSGNASYDLNGISGSSAYAAVGVSPTVWYGSSKRSALLRYTYSGGPLTVVVGDSLAPDNQAGPVGNNNVGSFAVTYAQGPLSVSVNAEGARTAANRTAYALGASYDAGTFKVSGSVVQSETENQTGTFLGGINGGQGYGLGVVVPFGAANIGLQYAHNSADVTVIQNATELFMNYSLSKRTSVYLDQVYASDTAGGKNMSYNLGLMHNF